MDAALAVAAGGGGGGGPAPFLLKTYEMVDDSATDHIVSWTPSRRSFVVWNPPEFSRLLLPTYFKHNNFSSFIRQLNTYGFHKIDPERWEFANDEFIKDKKHLLKNIHRRKPIHSHSQPPVDPERAALAKEIDKLSRENAEIQARLKAQQQACAAKSELDNLKYRVISVNERQKNLLNFFEKAVQNPAFVEQLAKRIESMDLSAYTKKRRLPQAQDEHHLFELPSGNNSAVVDNRGVSRPETASIIFPQDLSNALRLELSPALSDRNLISNSTHSSNEEMGSSPRRSSEDEQVNAQAKAGAGLQIAPETIDLTDTGTSLTFRMDSALSLKAGSNASGGFQAGQNNLLSGKETGDNHISCLLNLSLASSPFQTSPHNYPTEDARYSDSRPDIITNAKSSEVRIPNEDAASLSSSRGSQDDKEGETATPQPPARVNDVFWEQFLTERPGASDNEEASSNYRANPYDEQQDDRGVNQGISKTAKNLGKLSL